MWQTIGRELTTFRTFYRTMKRLEALSPENETTLPDLFEKWAQKTPNAPAIFYEDREITYREFDLAASQYGRWAQSVGIKAGDVVALLMTNRPAFLFAWVGLAKIGATTALLNTNQNGKSLAHSVSIANPKHLILGSELEDAWNSCRPYLNTPLKTWATGGPVLDAEDLDAALCEQEKLPLSREARPGAKMSDQCFLIYTSGTTGLPKAAKISHLRAAIIMNSFAGTLNTTQQDRMYVALPLYHTAGGVCAVGATLINGGAVILKNRFSVREFWEDIVSYEATLFQYIGEVCRYLLNAPPMDLERQHALRACVGNGLRPDIWEQFKERFSIPQIFEFYGATEGNVSLMNVDGQVGAVGRVPIYARKSLPVKVVQFDYENQIPRRGPDGRCIECAPGEVGEAIGPIRHDARSQFEGYTNADESNKKILSDVFEEGDRYFRTGDLLKTDARGYFYFVDRVGDTFRWKGENVATSEVSEALSVLPGVKEANVYGVAVPDADGKAGMAALAVDETFDLGKLDDQLEAQLPIYARPVFIRLKSEIEITSTFKHRKVDLARQGFEPGEDDEPVFFRDPRRGGYVPLDPLLLDEIKSGLVKL